MQTSNERQRELYQIAEAQGGYFTTKQAASLGYASNKRVYHVRVGNWLREQRGIYRLALFPESDHSDLMLWWLWSRDRSDQPSGVYSHQTALSLHELTDVNPSQLDMTVPPSFRRSVSVPRILRLHYGHVSEAEQEVLFSVPVTGALRTILDVWEEGSLPKAILRQAFQQAKTNGKITRKQAADLLKDARYVSITRELEAA
ncbi:MAG: type IV toxin-antitoxin system AbiEi family antitoxin domain-containing protein [Edaphobacter sp.]